MDSFEFENMAKHCIKVCLLREIKTLKWCSHYFILNK